MPLRYEERNPYEYTPDWLIEPSDRHPLLRKKRYIFEPPQLFQLLHKLKILQLGSTYEEHFTRTAHKPKQPLLGSPTASTQPIFVCDRTRPLLTAKSS